MDRWKFVFLLYCGLILYVSSLAPKELPEGPSVVSDKVLHLLEYGLWGILCWGAFVKRRGILDECWQDWLGRKRSADVWDAAADALGSFLGVAVALLFWPKR